MQKASSVIIFIYADIDTSGTDKHRYPNFSLCWINGIYSYVARKTRLKDVEIAVPLPNDDKWKDYFLSIIAFASNMNADKMAKLCSFRYFNPDTYR